MGNDDVDMEDARKLDNELGDNFEESEGKVLDASVENKGEEFPSAEIMTGNGSEDINEAGNQTKEQIVNQINKESEINETTLEDRSTGEQIYTKSESEERSSAGNNAEEQTAARSTADKLTDSRNEVVEQSAASGELEEENSTETVKGVAVENPSTDVAMEKRKGFEREDVDCIDHVARKEIASENADSGSDSKENMKFQTELSSYKASEVQNVTLDEVNQSGEIEMQDAANVNEDKAVNDDPQQQCVETLPASPVTDGNTKPVEASIKHEGDASCLPNQHEATTPNALVVYSPANVGGDHSGETVKTVSTQATLPPMGESDDGTPEEQAAFMRELESFYRERAMDYKPPKFYGQPLNCLKLWRAVIRLGGYDRVTGSKLWRQVGESFHPPKTCTTVSWTFRIFYEKSLLEYERHKRQIGDLQLPVVTLPEASGADSEGNVYQGSGSGRARRDAAARAMQGWHVQRLFGNGEVGEPVIKDKNISNIKREKSIKSIGSLKQKRPNEAEHSVKAARIETSKQLVTSVVDIGPPADWVKINVRQTKDCFEVYALVPGLLREEVRVQSDPAGRLVITGQPEQADNPWGITPFKKVVSLPGRIDPLQTSAVVSLHGRLYVRVPFEPSNA